MAWGASFTYTFGSEGNQDRVNSMPEWQRNIEQDVNRNVNINTVGFGSVDLAAARWGEELASDLFSSGSQIESKVYNQSFNSKETLVIGRLGDTEAGSEMGMRRLNEPNWSLPVNDSWMQGGIDANKPFYLGSNVSISNLRSRVNPMYPTTVFFRELTQLRGANYYREGDWMHPT